LCRCTKVSDAGPKSLVRLGAELHQQPFESGHLRPQEAIRAAAAFDVVGLDHQVGEDLSLVLFHAGLGIGIQKTGIAISEYRGHRIVLRGGTPLAIVECGGVQ
jgi:hypothetical protein